MLNQPRTSTTKVSYMLGIITALPQEARTLTKKPLVRAQPIKLSEQVLLIISGMGADNAENAAQQLLANGAKRLLSWGTAAGLNPQLPSGTLVLPKNILKREDDPCSIHSDWHQTCLQQLTADVPLITADLIHADKVLATPSDKFTLFDQTKAVAADMESYSVAKVAQHNHIPFLTIRVIADPASTTLPKTAINAVDQFGQVKTKELLKNLLCHLSECYRLCLLGHHFATACRTLRKIDLFGF